jgi:heme exporter protein D
MSFSNWQEFLAMGGYGFYVWASFGLTALVLVAIMLAPVQRHRALQRDLARQARRTGRENHS